jgi:tetratricopeptide (TPR) repeat protein
MLDMACERVMHGDLREAQNWRARAEKAAGSAPLPSSIWHMRLLETGFHLLKGDFDAAERLAAETTRLGRRIAHPYARGVERALALWLHRERGRYDDVLRIVEPKLPVRLGPTHWVQAVTGRALAAAGRHDDARLLYEDLISVGPDRIPRNIRWNSTIAELAHLCADLGDADRADSLIALLEPVAGQHGVIPMPIFYAGPFTAALGRLHALRGELQEAIELLEDALESAEALGARPVRTRILAWQGALLVRRGESTRAGEVLAQAAELARELGMAGVEADVRKRLRSPGS